MKSLLVGMMLLLLAGSSTSLYAQKDSPENNPYEDEEYDIREPRSFANIGIGLGLNYGGLGGRLSLLPIKHLGVFGGVGYNLHEAAYQFGVTGHFLPDKKVCPIFEVMYGFNAVIVVSGASQYNKTYFGPSIGAGIHLNMKNDKFMNFELIVPFRSQEFENDLNALQSNPNITGSEDPLPVVISIGYHFKLGGQSGY